MASIPAGEIKLRDNRKNSEWTVQIRPFLIGGIPVTQRLYTEVTGKADFAFPAEDHPAENVSWFDAIRFCNEFSRISGLEPWYNIESNNIISFNLQSDGYRLPTEAEWEYACKAGTTAPLYGKIEEIAWYKDNSGGTTQPAGLKMPNGWGMYDMLGNVWEWCHDLYDPQVYGQYRVFRGGGWSDPQRGCMATNRRRSHPDFRIDDLGFRLARSVF